jgi:hypothetical protein
LEGMLVCDNLWFLFLCVVKLLCVAKENRGIWRKYQHGCHAVAVLEQLTERLVMMRDVESRRQAQGAHAFVRHDAPPPDAPPPDMGP